MEQHIGRFLLDGEQVHHRNEDRSDNRIENLELLSKKDHAHTHCPPKEKKICTVCNLEKYLINDFSCHACYLKQRYKEQELKECVKCGKSRKIHAKGMCGYCYGKQTISSRNVSQCEKTM
jgi:hypothetical protein